MENELLRNRIFGLTPDPRLREVRVKVQGRAKKIIKVDSPVELERIREEPQTKSERIKESIKAKVFPVTIGGACMGGFIGLSACL